MSTENLKQEPKPSADFLKNKELTEEELRCVSGGLGLNCCAGAHYKMVTIAMRKSG